MRERLLNDDNVSFHPNLKVIPKMTENTTAKIVVKHSITKLKVLALVPISHTNTYSPGNHCG